MRDIRRLSIRGCPVEVSFALDGKVGVRIGRHGLPNEVGEDHDDFWFSLDDAKQFAAALQTMAQRLANVLEYEDAKRTDLIVDMREAVDKLFRDCSM